MFKILFVTVALIAAVACAPEPLHLKKFLARPMFERLHLGPKVIEQHFEDCNEVEIKKFVPTVKEIIEPLPVMELRPTLRHDVIVHHPAPVTTLIEKPKIIEKSIIKAGEPSYSYSWSNVNVHNPAVMEVEKVHIPGKELRFVPRPVEVMEIKKPMFREFVKPVLPVRYAYSNVEVREGLHHALGHEFRHVLPLDC